MEVSEFFKSSLFKVVFIAMIIAFLLSIGTGYAIVFFLGWNILGLGLGLIAMLIVSLILFFTLASFIILFSIIYYFLRDTGKEFRQTKSTSYDFGQQTEVGRKTQKMNNDYSFEQQKEAGKK
jgi:type III secretory pathway component EscU